MNKDKVVAEALKLPPVDRAELAEMLLASFETSSRAAIDQLWVREAEDRLAAYDRGELSATDADEVFAKINRLPEK